jgi:AcrR family transcriptional regulator
MKKNGSAKMSEQQPQNTKHRRLRADAHQNVGSLLKAAIAVFATSGVDAPVREIAEKAGVGVGTVYRHFPQRADLIAAVMREEIDACADAASRLAVEHPPVEAFQRWMQRYVDLISTKRGLAVALNSGVPAYDALTPYFEKRVLPALQMLLDAGTSAGHLRADVKASDLLRALAGLCMPGSGGDTENARRMAALLVDGLRYRANPPK